MQFFSQKAAEKKFLSKFEILINRAIMTQPDIAYAAERKACKHFSSRLKSQEPGSNPQLTTFPIQSQTHQREQITSFGTEEYSMINVYRSMRFHEICKRCCQPYPQDNDITVK